MTTLNWDFKQNDDKIALLLQGELSRHTLLPLWQQRAVILAKVQDKSDIEWDLSGISRIDSAGFALLCDLLRDCQAKINNVRLKHPPQQLLTLADLVGLTDWINQFID